VAENARSCSNTVIPYPETVELTSLVPLLAAGVAVASAAWSARAWPIGVRARVSTLQDRVEAAEAIVDGLAGKWHSTSAELAAFLEEAEGVLQAVEKKRRRIAASEGAAKPNGANALPEDPASRRLALTRMAREAGHQL